MKISHNWLQQFIKVALPKEEISEMLTDLGLEVEGLHHFESIKGGLKGVVVGKVLSCEAHPNADRLKITTVSIGEEVLPIVCGAPNVAKDQKVVVATVGTTLYPSEGEAFKINKSKIRGEVSMGMICAEDEVGIGQDHEGIIVLDKNIAEGTPAAEVFNIEEDYIYEIGLTPNRADAMSHLGVARDLKALCKLREIPFEWSFPETSSFQVDNNIYTLPVEVKNTEKCSQYYGLTISNLKVGPSPNWLQNRLKAIGINPKNNLVDITNYVMHELGQPLHAFDASNIKNKIIVNTFKKETIFTTLDEVERRLNQEDLMIGDEDTPHCIAGVFGGKDAGVTESTTHVFLESAYFDPVSIRKTAKYHGLNTDASFRFERGIDPEIGITALKRAAILIKQLCGGEISSDIQEFSKPLSPANQVFLSYDQLERTVGQKIEEKDLNVILNALEIEINSVSETGIGMTIPRYRVDVTRPADVIEEILRIYGYNNLESKPLTYEAVPNYNWKSIYKLENAIARQLTSFGFFETLNNSISTPDYKSDFFESIQLLNPLGQELSKMRQSLMHQALEIASFNINRQNKNLKLFEFGKIYGKKEEAYIEEKRLCMLVTGQLFGSHWNLKEHPDPFFYFKGILIDLFQTLGYEGVQFSDIENKNFESGFTISHHRKNYGVFGSISNELLAKFNIEQEVFCAELNWQQLAQSALSQNIHYQGIAKYPTVSRDFALLVDQEIQFEDLQKLAYQTERKILKSVTLFDVYEGKSLAKGKKSYGINFNFQDKNKTLTDKQVDKVMEKLLQNFKKEFNAELR